MDSTNPVTITYITTYSGMQPVAWSATFEYKGSQTATLYSHAEAENIQVLLEQMDVPLSIIAVEEDAEDAQ